MVFDQTLNMTMKHRYLLITLLSFGLVQLCFGQHAKVEWTRIAEDTTLQWARHKDITVDSAGNLITLSFLSPAYQQVKLSVMKLTPAGNMLWNYETAAFSFDTDMEEMFVRCDRADNVIVGFQRNDHVSAIKLSPTGTVLWSSSLPDGAGGGDDWETRAMCIDSNGDIYVTAEVTINYSAFHQVGVVKIDGATGGQIWKSLHSFSGDKLRPVDIALSNAGHLCVAARLSSSNTADIRLVSFMTTNGNLHWVKTYNSSFNAGDEPSSLAVTSTGDYVVGGLSSNGQNSDAFIARYSGTDGTQQWVQRFNNDANLDDWVAGILIDAQDNVFAVGSTQPQPVPGYPYQHDYLMTKHDGATGAVLWRKQYQSPCTGDSNDVATHACLDLNGNLIVTGYTTVGHSDAYTCCLRSTDGGRLWQQRFTRPDYFYDLGGIRVAQSPDGRCYIGIETHNDEFVLLRCNPAVTQGLASQDTSAVQMLMTFTPPDGLASTIHFAYKYYNRSTSRTVTGVTPNQTIPASTITQTVTAILTGLPPATVVEFQLVLKNSTGTYYSPGSSNLPTVWTAPMPPLPSISTDPTSAIVKVGDTVSFSTTTAGGPITAYQWRKNGSNLAAPAGTSSTFTIASAKTTDAGRYSLKVSNQTGSDTSADALLGVVNTTLPTVQFASGGTIALQVSAAAPSGVTLTYQWSHGGDLNNGTNTSGGVVSGAKTNKLTITKATLAEAGSYTCTVTMNGLSLTTDPATVRVVTKPTVTIDPVPGAIASGAFSWQLAASQYATGFIITGLPSGLSYNATTGLVSGIPNVSGSFKVNVSAKNAAGTGPVQQFTLVVASLPAGTTGDFTAWLSRRGQINGSLGGYMTLKVASAGTFTGTLKNGTASYNLSGRLVAPLSGHPTTSVSIKRTSPLVPLVLTLDFDGINDAVSGSLDDPSLSGYSGATVSGRRLIWSGTAARLYAAAYNSSIDLPVASQNDTAQPLGVGWQQMTVTAAGAASGSGRTAEGVSYTFSGSLWPDGSLPQFVLISSSKASVMGLPKITLGATIPDNRVTGWVDEYKSGPISTTDRTYASGIPYLERVVDGAPWVKPTVALPIVLGRADAPGNAAIEFSKGGVESVAQFSSLAQTFRINKTNTTTFATATTGNPCKVSMTITSSTGLFSGSFTLSDTVLGKAVLRPVSYAGILLSHRNKGYGYFMLPGLLPSTTTSPILGGRVVMN